MADMIDRQAAIDALNEVSEHYTEKGREWHPHVDFMIDAIKDLPPAQPEQKEPCPVCEGLEDGDTLYADSHWDGGVGVDYICDIKYCPVCGRKLKE